MKNPFNRENRPERPDYSQFTREPSPYMIGRNGFDAFARFCGLVGIVLIVVAMFFMSRPGIEAIISLVGFAFIGYSWFRTFSRNTTKRYRENEKFVNFAEAVKSPFVGTASKAKRGTEQAKRDAEMRRQYRKTHKFFRCPGCGHQLRVPKGKGKIRITCPNCKTKFDAKT